MSSCHRRRRRARRWVPDLYRVGMAAFPDPGSMLRRWAALAGVTSALGFPDVASVIGGGGRFRRRPLVATFDDAGGSRAWWADVAAGHAWMLWGFDRQHPMAPDVWSDPGLARLAAIAEDRSGSRSCSFALLHRSGGWAAVGATLPIWPPLLADFADDAASAAELADWVGQASEDAGHDAGERLDARAAAWSDAVTSGSATSERLRELLGPMASDSAVDAGTAAVASFDPLRRSV